MILQFDWYPKNQLRICLATWEKDLKNKIIRKNIQFFWALYLLKCAKKNEDSQIRELFWPFFENLRIAVHKKTWIYEKCINLTSARAIYTCLLRYCSPLCSGQHMLCSFFFSIHSSISLMKNWQKKESTRIYWKFPVNLELHRRYPIR